MNRSLLALTGLLVVLLIAYYFISSSEKAQVRLKVEENFVGIDSGAVTKIVIKRHTDSVIFEKYADVWEVEHNGVMRATEPGVAEQLARIGYAMKTGEIVSSNPEKQSVFEVDELTGKLVTFYRNQEELGAVVIGKTGPDFQSTYVRKPQSHDVYSALQNLARLVDRPTEQYRDKAILTVDTSLVTLIRVKSEEFDFQVSKQDTLWSLSVSGKSEDVDHNQLSQWLRQLSVIRTGDFVDTALASQVSFDKPASRLEVSLIDGSTLWVEFVVATEEPKEYYCRVSGQDEIFLMQEWQHNSLIKKPDELQRKEAT